MAFTSEEYRTYNTRLTRFMRMYSKFIAQDLYSSIQLKFEYNQSCGEFVLIDGGKKIDVLIYLYKLFIALMNQKNDEKILEELFSSFDEIIQAYLDSCQENKKSGDLIYQKISEKTYNISFKPIEDFLNNKFLITMFVMFNQALEKTSSLINSSSYITGHLKGLGKIKFTENSYYIVQSLYEFHNAVSHLYIALKSSNDDRNNINKAASHLHRGILDAIKNCIQLSNLTEEQKKELIELRIEEFNSIGINTLDNDKKNILVNYMYLL